jgi:hypothetical protein
VRGTKESAMNRLPKYVVAGLVLLLTGLPVLLVQADVVAQPPGQQENEAEKLFHAMEKKLHSATSIRVSFASSTGMGCTSEEFTGTASLAAGGLYRIEGQVKSVGVPPKDNETLLFISDGKSFYSKRGNLVNIIDNKAKPGPSGTTMRGVLPRFGIPWQDWSNWANTAHDLRFARIGGWLSEKGGVSKLKG